MCDLSLAALAGPWIRLAEDVSVTMSLQRPVRAVAAGEDRRAVGELDKSPVDRLRKDNGLDKLRRPLACYGVARRRKLQGRLLASSKSSNTKTGEKKILCSTFEK